MIISAGIAGITGVMLMRLVHPYLNQSWQLLVFITITLLWSLPLGWLNTAWGFQSAWFILLFFTLVATYTLLFSRVFSWQWWTGAVCGFLAFFSVSSGFFILLVIAALKAWLAWIDPIKRREHIATVLLCVAFILPVVAFILSLPPIDLMWGKVNTVNEFIIALGKALAFPWIGRPGFAFIFYAPFFILLGKLLWSRRLPTELEQIILVFAGWSLLQAITLAYGRGNANPYPSARQMDIFLLGVLANLLAFYSLSQGNHLSKGFWRQVKPYLVSWLVLFSLGMAVLITINVPAMERKAGYKTTHKQVLNAYIQTGDPRVFQKVNSPFDIPHSNPALLIHYLDDPVFQSALPLTEENTFSKQFLKNSSILFFISLGFYFLILIYRGQSLFIGK